MSTFTLQQALELATQHHHARRFAEAAAIYRQILQAGPDNGVVMHNLGLVLHQTGRHEEAYGLIHRSIALHSPPPAYYFNHLGEVCRAMLRLEEALGWYDRSLATDPDFAEAHLNKGIVLLLQGNLSRGWDEYEWRWRSGASSTQPFEFSQPRWDGGDLSGKTLLVWAEQGMGDTMQLARFAPLLVARGARVIFGCQDPLQRLLSRAPGVSGISFEVAKTPPFDVHAPFFALPRLLGTTLENIPPSGYLTADAPIAAAWRERLKPFAGQLKIGLVWAGRPEHGNDGNRSMALSRFAPLAAAREAVYFSLQKGPAAAQAATPPAGMRLIDYSADLTDFAESAGLLENLDLLISVDTAPTHLAGAMNKPVWTLLPYLPDWRWLLDRSNSPWYSTMKLFRRPRRGDWDTVIEQVAEALVKF